MSNMVIGLETKVETSTIIQLNPSEGVVVIRIIVSLLARGAASWLVLAVLVTMNGFDAIYSKFEEELQQVAR